MHLLYVHASLFNMCLKTIAFTLVQLEPVLDFICLFLINIHIFRHLKLEIALAISVSNDEIEKHTI